MMSIDESATASRGSDTLGRIKRGETGEAAEPVFISLGDGTAVVKETQVEIEPGERVLVAGRSGSGKSALVRAAEGALAAPVTAAWKFRADSRLFMLPQRPYIPSGSLTPGGRLSARSGCRADDEIGAAWTKSASAT